MTKVDQLPSEIVSLILSYIRQWYLPSCALVNKSFYREAMPLLWREISIYSEESLIAYSTRFMQSPNAPGHHVRLLSIFNILDPDRNASVLEQDVPNLDSLGDNIIVSLQHIPRYCPNLTTLDIRCHRNLIPGAHWIVQATIASAGQYCKQLTTLYLHRITNLNYDDLFDALKDVPLTKIWIILPRKLDEETLQRFFETAPLALHRFPLTNLTIDVNNDNTRFIHTINTHGLTWPHLTEFRLRGCKSLTDAMALTFVQTNPTIERLDLGYSGGIGDAFLDGLVNYLPNLTMLYVDFTAMTAAGICRLITNYDGRMHGVDCEGCEIYPEDVPDDKIYDYQLEWDSDEDEKTRVVWFNGTFYDNSDSEQDTQDDDDPS